MATPASPSPFAFIITAKPGDNLFALAALYLGDPLQWTRIAQLNLAALGYVADPFIPNGKFLELQMPPVRANASSTGIFGQ